MAENFWPGRFLLAPGSGLCILFVINMALLSQWLWFVFIWLCYCLYTHDFTSCLSYARTVCSHCYNRPNGSRICVYSVTVRECHIELKGYTCLLTCRWGVIELPVLRYFVNDTRCRENLTRNHCRWPLTTFTYLLTHMVHPVCFLLYFLTYFAAVRVLSATEHLPLRYLGSGTIFRLI